ncbi:unnamed protein product [Allacma fusca]|uniref:Intraflagellar transport protein 81 homolog n=1 Tax=Allacma fusca TaxID=39272 RepID=A0A8J2NZA8_9HEXA|nr:unnamed protein product [Allacma fusca]
MAKMTDIIKLVVSELAKEPFNKKFTIISFDSLKPEALLQILDDVLAEIEETPKVDLREEPVEDTVIRMVNTLRVLKYRPPEDNPSALRSGLVTGDTKIIHPILSWLLPRVGELKTRAYLAKYLVKVEVPDDIRADIEVEELYQQYESAIEQFKAIHKQLESMKSKGFTTSEIRKDITAMEQEQESVMRKIEKMKRRTDGMPNMANTLTVVRQFRKEREQSKELSEQGISQSHAQNQAEQRIQRLTRQLKEIRSVNSGATAEGHLQRLEQDTQLANYIVNDKLPKEMELSGAQISIYERVLASNWSEGDIEELVDRINETKTKMSDNVMRKMMKTEDDKLVMFRQQTAIVANKKETLVEKLQEIRNELTNATDDVNEKKNIVTNLSKETTVKEEDFKEYVKSLRVKSTRYKQMKAELAFLKSESGVLSKTLSILEEEVKDTMNDLSKLETRLGIAGYTETKETLEKISSEKAELDEKKSKHLNEMSLNVQDLHDALQSKKADLAPLMKSLNNLRQQAQMISHDHDLLKRTYDGLSASLESTSNQILKEVERLRKQYEDDQLKYCKLKTEISINKVNLKRMQEEVKIYTGGKEEKRKSFKEQVTMKLSELEKTGKKLKDEEKDILERQTDRANQALMWKDLLKLLECKRRSRLSSNGGFAD